MNTPPLKVFGCSSGATPRFHGAEPPHMEQALGTGPPLPAAGPSTAGSSLAAPPTSTGIVTNPAAFVRAVKWWLIPSSQATARLEKATIWGY